MYKIILYNFLFFFLLFGCGGKNDPSATSNTPDKKINTTEKTLSIGSVAQNYKYEEEIYRPIIQYLVDKLSDHGYTGAKSVIVGSLDELIDKANKNEIDIFFGSLYPTVTVDINSKLKPELKSFQNGVDHYYSVFFTNSNSKINSLENINGKMVAFENNYSTSGYFYPRTLLGKMGYKLEEYESPSKKVKNDRVGYSFSSDDGNTAVWVINNHVDIGVTDNEVFEYFSNDKKNKLKSIHTSKRMLRFITSIRNDIEDETREHLIKIFLNMNDDPEGKKLFNDLLQITKFETLDSLYYSEIKQDFKKFLLF